ncbi:hypothetical protein [Paenibacillus sp. GYB003]|uniref:hypothetical protein n=1 Tax=Paenibacillus sp. GYB003 TaxID=2994392 RepID=UPI002F964F1A
MFEQIVRMSRKGRLFMYGIAAIALIAALLPFAFVPEAKLPYPALAVAAVIGLCALIALVRPFTVLRVRVDAETLTIRLGWMRKRVELGRIVSCQSATYDWRHWGGWGIRTKPGATLYNVIGDEGVAVQLNLSNGSRLLFSSTEPEAVCAALRRQRPEIVRK